MLFCTKRDYNVHYYTQGATCALVGASASASADADADADGDPEMFFEHRIAIIGVTSVFRIECLQT